MLSIRSFAQTSVVFDKLSLFVRMREICDLPEALDLALIHHRDGDKAKESVEVITIECNWSYFRQDGQDLMEWLLGFPQLKFLHMNDVVMALTDHEMRCYLSKMPLLQELHIGGISISQDRNHVVSP